MRQIVSILLENETGALSRVVGLFSQRGYNIETITAAPTQDNTISRITITTSGDHKIVEQIGKQLNKLVNVIKVQCISGIDKGCVEREIVYVKIKAEDFEVKKHVKFYCDIFNAEIVDVSESLLIVQYVSSSQDIDRFLSTVNAECEIIETVRSGVCGIARGELSLHS